MENSSDITPTSPVPTAASSTASSWLSWSAFTNRILKTGFALLVFGAVLVILINTDITLGEASHHISELDPLPFLGGTLVLVALTMLGVPIIPAAAVGVAVWWVVQDVFF